jgi:prolyl-tRNA synthetase
MDIRNPVEGDTCPDIGAGKLSMAKGIEVGHIFKLGTKYSESMGATFLDENGKDKPMIMGCYGIGVARTAAAAIEQNNDDKGIIWPVSIAPFKVIVMPLQLKDEAVMAAAEDIYAKLSKAGHEPILDDRDQRPGVKFNEADLIGFPVQVIIGKKSVADGKVEIKVRKTGERLDAPLVSAIDTVGSLLESLQSGDTPS